VRVEEILLFGFHGVEHAAVGIDADKSSKPWKKVDQVVFGKFSHKYSFQ
jgi:hypothetical protein